ncbi:MAG: 3'(2'),5'-bisphosphate nucleotidase CysQ [Pseudomonadota bacterium]
MADKRLLADAAQGAAEIALSYWRNDPKTWEKPGDEGPVTEADLAVDAYLRETLMRARPEYGWMSEETADDPQVRRAKTLFIVDPIDGTRAYARGERTWAHALAVVQDGVPIAGVVHLPARDKLYAAAIGQGAVFNGVPLDVAREAPPLDRAHMLVTKPNLAAPLWRDAPPGLTRYFRPSLAYRMALVAEGRFDGMLTLRNSWEWDVAAGTLLITEAGGVVTDRDGAPLRFNSAARQTAGLIAAPPELHREIAARLTPGAVTQ